MYTWARFGRMCARVYTSPRCSRAYVYAKAARLYPEENHTRVTSRAYVYVYCMAKRGPMFSLAMYLDSPRSARFLPWILFVFRTARLFLRISTLAAAADAATTTIAANVTGAQSLSRSYLSATIAVIYDLGWWI